MPEGVNKLAIGLMSGTSCDGVDVALLRTDGRRQMELLGGTTIPYPDIMHARLLDVAAQAKAGDAKQSLIRQAQQDVTDWHIAAVQQFLAEQKLNPKEVHVVGFHGHTLKHEPENQETWQIGNGPRLAKELGIDVVYDFRANDIALGGQGAPVAPLFHRAALTSAGIDLKQPVVALNIGGVSNITYLHEDRLIAFDSGPGNALLDDWAKQHKGQFYDVDGSLAAAGKVDETLLASWLRHPYFDRPFPKSLDRHAFHAMVAGLSLSVEDGAATFTALTVRSIIDAVKLLPAEPSAWYVCGGGAYNPTMMKWFNELASAEVHPMDDLKVGEHHIEASLVEAYVFAYLAVRSREGLPITFSETTGVKTSSAIGGVFCSAAA